MLSKQEQQPWQSSNMLNHLAAAALAAAAAVKIDIEIPIYSLFESH
jgi:hypothetical protein